MSKFHSAGLSGLANFPSIPLVRGIPAPPSCSGLGRCIRGACCHARSLSADTMPWSLAGVMLMRAAGSSEASRSVTPAQLACVTPTWLRALMPVQACVLIHAMQHPRAACSSLASFGRRCRAGSWTRCCSPRTSTSGCWRPAAWRARPAWAWASWSPWSCPTPWLPWCDFLRYLFWRRGYAADGLAPSMGIGKLSVLELCMQRQVWPRLRLRSMWPPQVS